MSQDRAVPQDPESLEVRDLEAREIAARREAELRTESYDALVTRYLDQTVRNEIVGASGSDFDIEVEAFWETPKQPGTLVVHVIVGWRHRGSWPPVVREFLVGTDGHIVGRREPQWFRELDNIRRPVVYVLSLGVTATLAWIIWGHGSPNGTYYLVRGLVTSAMLGIMLGFRHWWVRRRRRMSTSVTSAPTSDAPG